MKRIADILHSIHSEKLKQIKSDRKIRSIGGMRKIYTPMINEPERLYELAQEYDHHSMNLTQGIKLVIDTKDDKKGSHTRSSWDMMTDPSSSDIFYYNKISGEISMDKPDELKQYLRKVNYELISSSKSSCEVRIACNSSTLFGKPWEQQTHLSSVNTNGDTYFNYVNANTGEIKILKKKLIDQVVLPFALNGFIKESAIPAQILLEHYVNYHLQTMHSIRMKLHNDELTMGKINLTTVDNSDDRKDGRGRDRIYYDYCFNEIENGGTFDIQKDLHSIHVGSNLIDSLLFHKFYQRYLRLELFCMQPMCERVFGITELG